jgi:hypothetical protein
MAIIKTLKNTPIEIPEVSDENYGEDLTFFFCELVDIINSISSPLDINERDFNFNNNSATPSDITGFLFSTSNKARFIAEYIITRDNGSNLITETGTLVGKQGASGWTLARLHADNDVDNTNFPGSNGDIGVEFSITSGGQVQYTSNNYPSQITGTITFKARALEQ